MTNRVLAGKAIFLRRVLLGSNEKRGLIFTLLLYSVVFIFCYVFIYPILFMFVTSVKSLSDLIGDTVVWIPSGINLSNYAEAIKVLDFKNALWDTLLLTLLPTACQIITASLTGYGLAQFEFRGKKPFIALLILGFITPRIATMMPTYVMYKQMNLIGSVNAVVFPAALGQGLNAAIIILVFYQFYRQISGSVIEAAKLDGCGQPRIFLRIALPSVMSAFIIAFIFSFVWYWNETTLVGIFVTNTSYGGGSARTTLLINLQNFENYYKALYGGDSLIKLSESVVMAGTALCVAPLILLYFVLQRFFVQSIDMVGIKD